MKEQLVILAKEKGYNSFHTINREVGNGWYIELCLLQKWLREVHKIFVDVHVGNYAWNNKFSYYRSVRQIKSKYDDKFYSYRVKDVSSYEEALEIGLQEGLNLIN